MSFGGRDIAWQCLHFNTFHFSEFTQIALRQVQHCHCQASVFPCRSYCPCTFFSYHVKWSDVLLWKVSLQQCSILNDSNRRSVRSKMLPITIFGDGGCGVDLRLGFVRWSAPWRFPSITAAGQNCKSNGNFGSKSLFLRQNWKCRGRLRGVFYAGQSRIDLTCRQK